MINVNVIEPDGTRMVEKTKGIIRSKITTWL